jgi:hypothetical protein
MPKQPHKAKKAAKKASQSLEPPQRQLVYAGPPGLKEALRKLPSRPPDELDRSILSRLDHAAPSPPAPVRRKQGSGGRRAAFTQKQLAELQREDRLYRKQHPGALEKDVAGHLLAYAKDQWKIVVIGRTLHNNLDALSDRKK